MIDCAICYKTFEGEIQMEPKPYIHCVHKPVLTQVLIHPLFLTNQRNWVLPCMHTMHKGLVIEWCRKKKNPGGS